MNNNEIKQANKKALPKLLIFVVISVIVGWTTGYCFGKYRINELTDTIKDVGVFFGLHIAPWLVVAMAVIMPITCLLIYKRARKQLDCYDGEDEDILNAIEKNYQL